jgi:hypothetical protein
LVAAKKPGAHGLKSAQFITQFLASTGATIDGVALHARAYPKRPGTTTNDVIEYLAEAHDTRPARDIRPSEEEAFAAAELLVREYHKEIVKGKGRAEGQGSAAVAAAAKKQETVAAAKGFRKGGKYIQRAMAKRVESGLVTGGGSAEQVEQERYAPRRQREFGVPLNKVYKRTGLLTANVTGGVLKLHRKGA